MVDQYLGIDVDFTRDALFDELGLKRLKESYMKEDETSPQQRFAFVSKAFGSNPEHAQRLYDYSSKHWLSYSTPILSFGRSAKGLPISCFLSYMPDSSAGLVDTLSETNWLSMLGGGIGVHVKIRSADEKSVGVMPHLKIYDASCLAYRQGKTRRGSYAMYMDISHPDIIQFLEIRKPTGDPNIRCLNLHHGINVSDKFMQIIENCMLDPNANDDWHLYDPYKPEKIVATVSAKNLWERILEIRMQTGEPYLEFIDTANAGLPVWLKEKGLTINGSNLCLTGDTRITTNKGVKTLDELYLSQEMFLVSSDRRTFLDSRIIAKRRSVNGHVIHEADIGVDTFNSSKVILTNAQAEIYQITTASGYSLKGTSSHNVMTTNGWRTIGDIQPDDKILIQSGEGLWSTNYNLPDFKYDYKNIASKNKLQNRRFEPPTKWTKELGEIIGWLIGDGYISKNRKHPSFVFGNKDYDLVARFENFITSVTDNSIAKLKFKNCIQLVSTDKRFGAWFENLGVKIVSSEQKTVPNTIFAAPREAVIGFLRGLFGADGSVDQMKDICSCTLSSTSRTLLEEVQILLQNFGIRSSIYYTKKKGQTLLFDSKLNKKLYDTQDSYTLKIGKANRDLFISTIGYLTEYKTNKVISFLRDRKTNANETKTIGKTNYGYRGAYRELFEDRVISKQYVGIKPVYDIHVDTSHSFIANGIVVHNCNEIQLATNKDRTAVCCLSSLNLEHYDQWKDNYQFFRDVLEMLDNVLQYFIDNAPDVISRARYSAMMERSVGVGALGFHTYLQSNLIPWESAIAKSTNMRIFKNINKNLHKANLELGKERGEAPDAVGHGIRLSHTLAIAPNASSSIIMGNCSPSIEPFRANAFRQDTLSGSSLLKNKFVDAILKERLNEKDYDKAWKTVISSDGSVQHLDCLTQDEKDVFKTSMELNQQWIVEFAGDRQEYIDQGQSVNLFFRPDANVKYLHAVHFMAWKQKLKGLYYLRSDSIRKADKVSQSIERKIIDELDMRKIVDGEGCLACE